MVRCCHQLGEDGTDFCPSDAELKAATQARENMETKLDERCSGWFENNATNTPALNLFLFVKFLSRSRVDTIYVMIEVVHVS